MHDSGVWRPGVGELFAKRQSLNDFKLVEQIELVNGYSHPYDQCKVTAYGLAIGDSVSVRSVHLARANKCIAIEKPTPV